MYEAKLVNKGYLGVEMTKNKKVSPYNKAVTK